MHPLVIETVRRAKRFRQRARILGRPHAICLMYHRIAMPDADPWDLSVSPTHFDEHLTVLRKLADCRSFGDLISARNRSDRPRRMAAITFDDGYRDNLAAAAPLLEAHGVPATVFVATGMTGAQREFWWDALTRAFLATPSLPEVLELDTENGRHIWHLGGAATCTPEEMRGLARARLPFDLDLHPRVRLLADVREVLFSTSKDEADHLAEVVLHWSGLDRGGVHGDRPMTENEVGRLAASGLVEIGAHTVTHRPLDRVSQTETHDELSRSRAVLRDIVGKNVATFAYPYGRFGPQTPRLVAEAGFSAACTTQEFLDIGAGGDPFLFPRITVRDCDGDAFSRMLRDFVGP